MRNDRNKVGESGDEVMIHLVIKNLLGEARLWKSKGPHFILSLNLAR